MKKEKIYKGISELEKYYKDMKKKYPHLDIWDEVLEYITKRKNEILKCID